MNAPEVRIARGGLRLRGLTTRCREISRYVDRRIAFHETRQLGSLGSYVADLEQKIGAERSLHVQVPVLRIGERKIRSQRQVGQRGCESAVGRRIAEVGIGKIEECGGSQADLLGLQVGRSADGRLQWPALARVVRLVKDSVGGGHQPR